MHRALAPAFAALAALLAAAVVGCSPSIGDRCNLSTDCSVQGSRFCDTSQPGGYCTLVRCTADNCPDNAACVQFGASVPGCRYDDYAAPSRAGRAMCLKTCESDSDCRQSDGYLCVSLFMNGKPADPTASTVILDTDQSKRVCMLNPTFASYVEAGVDADVDADVCSSRRPDVSPLDASLSRPRREAGADAGEAGADAGEAGADAGEAGADAGEAGDDAGAAGTDAAEAGLGSSEGGVGDGDLAEAAADAFGDVDASIPVDAGADADVVDAAGGS